MVVGGLCLHRETALALNLIDVVSYGLGDLVALELKALWKHLYELLLEQQVLDHPILVQHFRSLEFGSHRREIKL